MHRQVGIASRRWGWAAVACAWAAACSSSDRDFDSKPDGQGGAAGEAATGGGNSAAGKQAQGDAGIASPSEMAGASSLGGNPNQEGTAGAGGAEGTETPTGCSTAYSDWFRATFPYPEGGVLGVADFPSSPWRTLSGTLTTTSGAAVSAGSSVAVASQGAALPYDGVRARFNVQFSKGEQTAALRFNASAAGAGGIAIRIAGDTGELTLTAEDQPLSTKSFGAIALNTPVFVQATFENGTASVSLSTKNYTDVPGAVPVGALDVSGLKAATGTYAAIELAGTGASIDDIGFARCGAAAPKYKALLRDTFNRASSATPGAPELPAASTWAGDTDNISITSNALTFSNMNGGIIATAQGQHYASSGLRIRASVKFDIEGWFFMLFNGTPAGGGTSTGFDLWREKDTNVYIEYGNATGSGRFPISLDVNTFYFLQFDVQDEVAVATMRTGGYDGPILFGSFATGFTATPGAQATFGIGNTWSSNLAIDEVLVDQYAP